jgi:hypothetical protein
VWERAMRAEYHYTQPDFAELILAEQTYRVSAQAGRAGYGLYVTTAQPGSMPDEQLLPLLLRGPVRSCSQKAWSCCTTTPSLGCGTSLASTCTARRRWRRSISRSR